MALHTLVSNHQRLCHLLSVFLVFVCGHVLLAPQPCKTQSWNLTVKFKDGCGFERGGWKQKSGTPFFTALADIHGHHRSSFKNFAVCFISLSVRICLWADFVYTLPSKPCKMQLRNFTYFVVMTTNESDDWCDPIARGLLVVSWSRELWFAPVSSTPVHLLVSWS